MHSIALLFAPRPVAGMLSVRDGRLEALCGPAGARIDGAQFELPEGGRLDVRLADLRLDAGSFPTLLQVESPAAPFTFFVRDVCSGTPIWIPEYEAAVVPGDDGRDYRQVAADLRTRHLRSDFDRFEQEPEESYAHAAAANRLQVCPTWLGVGRDPRLFRVGYLEAYGFWGEVQPALHTFGRALPGSADGYSIRFVVGQGASCRPDIVRTLEEDVLPILRSVQREQDLRYEVTAFATLESGPLAPGVPVRGADWQACYACTGGNMLPPEEGQALRDRLADELRDGGEEVLCCLRVTAVNTGRVPRYAWFRSAWLQFAKRSGEPVREAFAAGVSCLEPAGVVFAVQRIDGRPMPDPEMAILLPPGGSVDFDLILPHGAVPPGRAAGLLGLDFDAHLRGCRDFWRARLASAAEIRVPEAPVDASIRAGLLHCDLVTLGRGTAGPLLPTIGWYSPIGTESAPILQFYDSMGWHDLAERGIQFFFERQRPDGMIQNFARYESETGPLLWTAGEHFRYTRDTDWVRRVAPHLRRAADFLLRWRQRNLSEEARARGGYGMVDGKVADPDDFYHSFFLNAGTYLGLKRAEEMLRTVDPAYAAALARELPAFREDIRAGFHQAQARAPVVPLGDGSWAPLAPPWCEHRGGTALYADGGRWFTHGSFATRDSLIGAWWLVLGEVLEPDELGTDFLVKTHAHPVTLENAALSQPYYCRHDYAHLRRGETKAFLKAYYNQLTALQDRETRTFWEHYYHASQHKTHEEAWFLMQTRWMLWLEDGGALRLLEAVPRSWLRPGGAIRLRGVRSYFGALTLQVRACGEGGGRIEAEVELEATDRLPESVRLRLPHPDRRAARRCEGGVYDPAQEAVALDPAQRSWRVILEF